MNSPVLTFLGDVFPLEPVDIRVELTGGVVPNLESPLTSQTSGYPGKINLRSEASNVTATFDPLPIAVSLANNHIMDFFEPGYQDTIAALDELGVGYFGAGAPANRFNNPHLVDVGGMSVALLGYAHSSSGAVFHSDTHSGPSRLVLETVLDDIEASRALGAERVVIVAHWGHEHVALPPPRCVDLAHAFVDAGADLVIGHHSHCIQSYEVRGGKHIFYGLGNCIFPAHQLPSYFDESGQPTVQTDSRPTPRSRRSLAVTWDPRTEAVAITPLYFDGSALVRGRFRHGRYRIDLSSTVGYAKRYSRMYRLGKLRQTIERFLKRPKLPRLHHVKSITELMRSPQRR